MKLTTNIFLLAALVKASGVASSSSSFLRVAAGVNAKQALSQKNEDPIDGAGVREGGGGNGNSIIKSGDKSLQTLMAQRRIKREENKGEKEKKLGDEEQQEQQPSQMQLPSSPACAPLTVWFKTDNNKSDNEFYVFDFESKTYIWDQWSFDKNTVYISKLCIKRDGCVGFHFIDDTGDG